MAFPCFNLSGQAGHTIVPPLRPKLAGAGISS